MDSLNRFRPGVATLPRASLLGVGLTLGGICWDAYLHANDPSRVFHEGLVAPANPGHLLIAAGIGLSTLAQAAMVHARLQHAWQRAAFALGTAGAVLLVALVLAWSSAQQVSAVALPGHEHQPSRAATPADVRAANALLAETMAGVERYRDAAVAIADGYRPATPTSWLISEWINPSYAAVGRVLDPRHPERLMYVNGPGGPVLAGVMFVMPSIAADGPLAGGPLTPWHRHGDLCFMPNGTLVGTNGYGFACPPGSRTQETPAMLHVWVVNNPAGPFAEDLSPRAIVRMLDGA
jgi:hypothetical protein